MMTSPQDLPDHPTYAEFEIEIGPGRGRSYPIRIASSAGDLNDTMHFPFDPQALKNHLLAIENAILRAGQPRRKVLTNHEQPVKEFGEALFKMVLPGEASGLYYQSRHDAARMNMGLRLRLRIQPPELVVLPWEFLYDPRHADYVALSTHTPIVRDIGLAQPKDPIIISGPLRILGMVSSPRGLEPLDTKHERARVESALSGLSSTGAVELNWLDGQTWQALKTEIRRNRFHAFHFIGHGGFNPTADEGLIALADEAGDPYFLHATELARLLADQQALRLVVLNSCEGARGGSLDIFSSTASILIRRGIPAVLAMQYEITDSSAIAFARDFYEALADGIPIDGAVSSGRQAMSLALEGSLEWATPVLYQRSPDGVLFRVQHSAKTPSPVVTEYQNAVPEQEHLSPVDAPEPHRLKVGGDPLRTNGVAKESTDDRWKRADIRLLRSLKPSRWSDSFTLTKTKYLNTIKEGVTSLTFSPDGRTLASGSQDQMIRLWQVADGNHLRTIGSYIDKYRFSSIRSLAFSPDGQTLASGGRGEGVQLWRVGDGRFLRKLEQPGSVECLAFSPDGRFIASGGYNDNNTVHLWRVADGRLLHTLEGHTESGRSLAFSPDGHILASGSADTTVRLWGVADGRLLHTLEGHTGAVFALVFLPNGQVLVSGSNDHAVQFWRVADGVLLRTLWHTDRVELLALSSDGQVLATGSGSSGTVVLWRVADGRLLQTFEGHTQSIYSLAFSTVGHVLASGSADTTVRLWQIVEK